MRVYSDEFLEIICDRLNVKKADRDYFKSYLEDAAKAYLRMVKINSKRITPREQAALFDGYAAALETTQKRLNAINEHNTTKTKLFKSLRRFALETKEPGMKEMLTPYITEDSMSIGLFDKFLTLLIAATEQAKSEQIGKDQRDLSMYFLEGWVASIQHEWVICSEVPFQHGKTYKELGGETLNQCPEILGLLFEKIDPAIPKSRVKTALKNILKITDLEEQ